MVRNYRRKTDRGNATEEQYRAAVKEVNNGISVREAARLHNLCAMSLSRYLKKNSSTPPGYSKHRQVFTAEQELVLADYMQESAERHFGLSFFQARRLAYQCVEKFSLRRPTSWDTAQKAGEDWLAGFRKRHQLCLLYMAENTSLSRAMGFNKLSVDRFFTSLIQVFSRTSYGPEAIYNFDETGVTTVPDSNRVLAKQGTRSEGRTVSIEKGALVTIVCAINAIGHSIPPMFIFPMKNFRSHFLNGAPPGSAGIANGSGWTTEETFLQYLQHFVRHAKPDVDRPVLLVLDNHVSHVSITTTDYCRENYMTLLSIPPLSSHKLQPLDRIIYGPFKTNVNNSSHAWMGKNPGRQMEICDILSIVSSSLPRAMLQSNITEAFRSTGIWPLNRDIFSDADFAVSKLIEQSHPATSSGLLQQQLISSHQQPHPSTSSSSPQPQTSNISAPFSPYAVLPIPQTERKKSRKVDQRKRKSES